MVNPRDPRVNTRLQRVGGLEHFFSIYSEESSQVTNSIIFQRGRSTTNQPHRIRLAILDHSDEHREHYHPDA